MKLTFKITIGILFISIVYILFLISENLDYRIKISSWLAHPNKEFIISNEIKEININLNSEDDLHFEELFKDFIAEGLGEENKVFLSTYSLNNKWRYTTLKLFNEEYNIKVKAHGRSPYAQKFGEHFSLAIKFLEKPYPFFSKRINLIVYNRNQLRSELIKLLSGNFELPTANFEIVSAKIGNHKEYIYFVEERINKTFFSKRNLPWIIFNKGIEGSLIYHGNIALDVLSKRLSSELEKKNSFSDSLKIQIINDYSKFNQSIYNKSLESLYQFIDINYCSRINAFRIINGDDGHGFSSFNFEMAYDTINQIFFPIIHRDNYGVTLTNCSRPFTFMDSTRAIIPFFIALDSDTTFINLTEQVVNSFLIKDSMTSPSTSQEIDDINTYYKQLFLFDFSAVSRDTDGEWIKNNIDCLNLFIDKNEFDTP